MSYYLLEYLFQYTSTIYIYLLFVNKIKKGNSETHYIEETLTLTDTEDINRIICIVVPTFSSLSCVR